MNNWTEKFIKRPFEWIYVDYPWEDVVTRIKAGEGQYMKFYGKEEFKATDKSKLAFDALNMGTEITKEEYDKK